MPLELRFIGTSDSKGVPRLGCACDVCREARPGSRDRRSRAAIWLAGEGGRLLVDTPPELRLRLADEGLERPDGVLLTHAHDDHILGLADVVNAFRMADLTMPLAAAPPVFADARQRFGYLWDLPHWRRRLDERPLTAPADLFGFRVEAVHVPHGFNGDAYGFVIAAGGVRVGYFPDAIDIPDLAPLRGLDLLVLGANFESEAHKARWTRSVYDVEEALAVGRAVEPGQLMLTHMSHAIRYTDLAPRLPSWAALAYDGLRLTLGGA